MEKFKNKMKVACCTLGALACTAGSAFAASVLPAGGVDLSDGLGDVTTAVGAVVGGLALIWGIRKVIKLMNRS